MVKNFHEELGHIGVKKLIKELDRRYEFESNSQLVRVCKEVKGACVTCKACEPPNWNTSLPLSSTIVPDYIMTSVALDILSYSPRIGCVKV